MLARIALALALALALVLGCAASRAQDASPHAIDIPPWFANTFLDFREDVADAAREGKRLVAYFGQDGCPYCRALMTDNFSQRDIVRKTRENFIAVALNIFGDRDTTWLDGQVRSEKALARFIGVQFTPTLLFFDEKGDVVARLDGYYPPDRFEAVLDYVAAHAESREDLGSYLSRRAIGNARAPLRDEPFFLRPPYELARSRGAKPLAVIFETSGCRACEELHDEAFRRSEVRAGLARFDVARFALGAATPLVTPDGRSTSAAAWARDLKVAYTPAILFFDDAGREVFRVDAYLRPFHLSSVLDYVASGAYRTEPSFQRFIQARADRLRGEGATVDLWR
jgi:thioredoxin-related protein